MKVIVLVMAFVVVQVTGHMTGLTGQDITINIAAPSDRESDDFVAFSVGSCTRFTAPPTYARIPMEVIIYNDGGYFHPKDNSFHAPVTGVYSFSFSGLGKSGKPLTLHLYRERAGHVKVMMARAYDHGTTGNNGAGASIIMKLDKGDMVSVWTEPNHTIFGGSPPSGPTTLFSGKLEKQLA